MKRFVLGFMVLMAMLVLSGCDEGMNTPRCYRALVQVENIEEWQGLAVKPYEVNDWYQIEKGIQLINTGATQQRLR